MTVPKMLGTDNFFTKVLARKTLDAKVKSIIEERQKKLLAAKDVIADREMYLQAWFEDSNMFNIINKNESKCSELGDCVYHVGWDEKNKCPIVKTYDPGFCFPFFYTAQVEPSWDVTAKEKVIERFILAWEEEIEEDEANTGEYFKLYREVYELREYANGDLKCFVQKGFYAYAGQGKIDDAFDPAAELDGTEEFKELPEIDFIPFVWVPNISVEGEEPFGLSTIQHVIDLIDKLINNYTDLSTNAEYLGGAVIGLSGESVRLRKDASTGEPIAISIKPRTSFALGKDGKMSLIDTSTMQTALLATIKQHEDKFYRMMNLPDAMIGRAGDSPPSGYALRILAQPLIDHIAPMRADRQNRYSTLFYYVQQYFAAFGDDYEKYLFAGELYNVLLNFGEIIPNDDKSELENLKLMKEAGFSDEFILTTAKEDGWKINVEKELEGAAARKAEDAARVTDILGMRQNIDNQNQNQTKE